MTEPFLAERGRQFDEALALLDTLVGKAPVGFAFVDRDLRYVRVNEALAGINGLPIADHLGRPIREVVPDLWPRVEPSYRGILKDGVPATSVELSGETPAAPGRVRHWLVNRYPVRVRGEVTGVGVIVHEITEQKSSAIGLLGVAHDVNNLLAVISSSSDLLLSGLRDDPMRVLMEEIQEASERLAALSRQLLAYGRGGVVAPRVAGLNEVIPALERLLRRVVGEGVTLRVTMPARPLRVKMEPGQLEQVLMNLVINARDAMPAGGRLTVEARPSPAGSHALLAVSDTGCGMTPEVKAHIFEPCFTTKGPGKGTGLGLATVQNIVKQAGGYIDVESDPGVGTTFKVYLPLAGHAEKRESQQ